MPTKYRNKKTVVDGVVFDSAKEAKRWQYLCLLQRAGQITGLERQVRIPIVINGIKVCSYVADACYYEDGSYRVEDTKSDFTRKLPVYRLKKKLIKAVLGIDIVET